MNKKNKGIKNSVGLSILMLVLLICIATSFGIIQFTKMNLEKNESILPESAISTYLHQVKNDDFKGIYENSLLIDPHMNKQEDYIQEIKNIYTDVSVEKLMFEKEKNESDAMLYGLYDGNTKISTIKLVKSLSGKWLASTLFQADHSTAVEVPNGVTFKVNGLSIGDEYITTKNVPATNFSGLKDTTNTPKVNRYELNNLISEPVITLDNPAYTAMKDALSNTYFVGKTTTDSDLLSIVLNYAKTCAKYPTKDSSLGSISAITITNSDFYNRLKTMDNQWFASHGVAQFSNEDVLTMVQQDDDSMIANVVFDYYIASGSTSKEYNIGYQISLLRVNGKWKIAGFAIDNEMNEKTKKW